MFVSADNPHNDASVGTILAFQTDSTGDRTQLRFSGKSDNSSEPQTLRGRPRINFGESTKTCSSRLALPRPLLVPKGPPQPQGPESGHKGCT